MENYNFYSKTYSPRYTKKDGNSPKKKIETNYVSPPPLTDISDFPKKFRLD